MKKLTINEFIEKAKKIHGDKYDYSKVIYINNRTKVCIICPIHGEFWQTPSDHLLGKGCKKCGMQTRGEKHRSNTYKFTKNAKRIHGNKYDYSKVKYINNRIEVCIICPIHGEFWQKPNYHLSGNGCPLCNESHLERDIRILFDESRIGYEYRKRDFEWLDGLELDFYIPEYRIAIECQGIQHFKSEHFFEALEVVQGRDKKKKNLCEKNNIKLLYYSDLNIDFPYEVITDKNNLLKIVKSYEK